MAHTKNKTGAYIVAIASIGILSLLVIGMLRKDREPDLQPPQAAEDQVIDPIVQEKPCCVAKVPEKDPVPIATKPVVTPKEETPSTPTQTLPTQTPPPSSNPAPAPIVVQVTTPPPTVIVQTSPKQEPKNQMPTETTYTIKQEGNTVLSSVPIDQVRTFTAGLNNYVSWKNKAKTADVDTLKDMLSSNGYELSADN